LDCYGNRFKNKKVEGGPDIDVKHAMLF
jgi:hypothetical protein